MNDPTNRRVVSVFLDANVIYAASLSERGGSSRLWALECYQLVTNEYALIEAHENLRKLESAEVLARFDLLMQRVEVVGTSDHRRIYLSMSRGVCPIRTMSRSLRARSTPGVTTCSRLTVGALERYTGRRSGACGSRRWARSLRRWGRDDE